MINFLQYHHYNNNKTNSYFTNTLIITCVHLIIHSPTRPSIQNNYMRYEAKFEHNLSDSTHKHSTNTTESPNAHTRMSRE